MGELGAIRGAGRGRGFLGTVLLAVLALLLTACSAGSILTDSGPSNGSPKGKTVPPVAFQQIAGIPPDKLQLFKQSLASAGGQHDIGFVEGNLGAGVFSLGGSIRANSGNAGVRVVYEWQFRDADGVLIDTLTGEDNAGVYSGPDPWQAVTPDVLDRVARRTADLMAQKLAAMGYAARLARLTAPPPELFAKAGPTAGRQIDFETVHGPGLAEIGTTQLANADEVVEHEEIKPWLAAVSPIPGEELMPKVAVSDDGRAAEPPATDDTGETALAAAEPAEPAESPAPKPVKQATAVPATAKPDQQPIRAVAVVPVKGSPGGGDDELTSAMRKTLSAAGWPVVSKPQADALTIEGHVKLAEKDGKTQSVSLRWLVKSPTGKVLGDVKQANEVPAGSLDGGWGGAATAVAEAAATGIFDVVKRYR
ncbi:hypothetical protein DK847_00890 [Aestuariivirga litoralis]|uniref:Lipoprotein n=1 Tax=Aestuariivirga litoralis TaxID=2650924 RepID=A0A2W2BRS9_9HYPH|nr:hypothetical protein [Aestuariivirga litoralis]PZF78407.1 hypothetical protein DK847_00890 [Aestuariivirga litoralis]